MPLIVLFLAFFSPQQRIIGAFIKLWKTFAPNSPCKGLLII